MKTSNIIGFSTAFYFGVILSILTSKSILDWKLWLVFIPVIVGFGLEKEFYKNGK